MRWTRAELERSPLMAEIDIPNCELIDGNLIARLRQTRPYVLARHRLFSYMVETCRLERVEQRSLIDVHPDDIETNEPIPALIVLNKPAISIRDRNPGPADILLICEIAETTLAFDLSTKANLYSRAGIVEYWVLDVNNSRLIVHREPAAEGFRSVQVYCLEESVAPLAAPQAQTPLSTFFS